MAVTGPLKGLERLSRRVLARLLIPVAGVRPAGDSPPPEPDSILVNRPDSRLGNLVLVMPLMAGLRERFPGARIVLLASDRFSGLPASQGCEVISVAKVRMASRPWLFPGFAKMIRREGFDCVLDASHPFSFSLSGAVVGGLAGAGTRIGFAAGDFEGWYTHPVSGLSRDEHESLTIHRLGSPWPGWPGYVPPRLIPRNPSVTGGIGLHVGASRGKFYPFEKMASLIRDLGVLGRVTLFWGGETELETARSLEGAGVSVAGRLTVTALMDALAGLDAFVSADNGPMHVASALGVPVVALFRIPNQARFGPLSPGSRVLLDPEGAEPGLVLEAVRQILGASAGRRIAGGGPAAD